jgi:hypothetical protein
MPLAAAAGVYVSTRLRRRVGAALPALCGLSVAVPYLLLIGYAAPRFLLPAYALLSIPVAEFLVAVARPARPRLRPYATAAVALVVVAQLVSQNLILNHAARVASNGTRDYARMAADLRAYGVRPPCLLTGNLAIPVAYQARCSSVDVSGHNQNTTRADIVATARTEVVAVFVPPNTHVPSYAQHWASHPLTGLHSHHGYRVYVSPSAQAR